MVTHITRVWINRVRLPILHVVSWTGKTNISRSYHLIFMGVVKVFWYSFLFFFNLTHSRWTSSLPPCLWPQRIFPSLPGSCLTNFLSRCKFSTLTTDVNQWLNFISEVFVQVVTRRFIRRCFQEPSDRLILLIEFSHRLSSWCKKSSRWSQGTNITSISITCKLPSLKPIRS